MVKYFCQLNLNGGGDKGMLTDIHQWCNQNNEVIIDNVAYVQKNMIEASKLYYKGDRRRDVLWLALLNAKSYEELNEIASQLLTDEERLKLIKEVVSMALETYNLHEWQKEKFDEFFLNRAVKEARESSFKKGKKQTTVEIIKNMLDSGLNVKLISKVTHRSVDSVNAIKNSMDER